MRTMILSLCAALALGACATAGETPNGVVAVLRNDSKVVVRLDADGKSNVVSTGRAGDIGFTFAIPNLPFESWIEPLGGRMPQPTPGELTFYMWSRPEGGAVVVLTNGTDKDMIYSANIAVIDREGRPQKGSTSICTVPAGRSRAEIWPDRTTSIEVLNIRQPPSPGVCFDPASGRYYQEGTQPPSIDPAPRPQNTV